MATKKLCFVTVGATASFNELVAAVVDQEFVAALSEQGYTDLLVQYGKGGQGLFDEAVATVGASSSTISISGFELDPSGLSKYMREAKGKQAGKPFEEGVVISHAGSGTVLDALRISVPLIVVPNTSLLDNHQVELAEALAEQGYVVHGQLKALVKSLHDADTLRKRQHEWPPVNSGKHREHQGLRGVLDEEMGFLD